MIVTVVLLGIGLGLLVAGGEALVQAGSGIGRALGLSPLVVGLTVVAFATSAPELAVTVDATFSGAAGLAVGNVVGSNITNILLVLGVAALVLPVTVRRQLVRIDIPVLIFLSVLMLVLALNGSISRPEGLLFLAVLLVYLFWSIRTARRAADPEAGTGGKPEAHRRPALDTVFVVAGVALLVLGARLLVASATDIARAVGLSDLVIGLTVVSIGTSLPEVATSIIAALRGEREMALGNVVGSSIFNIGAVLGITALLTPNGIPVEAAAVRFDVPVMVVVALALLPVAFTGARIARREAAFFLLYYTAYIGYLLAAAEHDALPVLSSVLLWFVMPMTAGVLLMLSVHEVHTRRRAATRTRR